MKGVTLHDLQCFDAVLRAGGFQAAAAALHRSHAAVFAAVAKLERQLGLALLDRSGYRVRATSAGSALQRHAQALLGEMERFSRHAEQLAMGEESELRVVVGDLCPRAETLGLLSRFFGTCPGTRLHLGVEAVTGPWERLLEDEADLILHRVDKSDARLEWVDLCEVRLVPVVAPGFLPFAPSAAVSLEALRAFTQCIVRDTARQGGSASFFVIEGAPQCSVPDQLMKKDIILQGMAWGHLPRFLIEEELRDGRLLMLPSPHLPGRSETLVAARRRDRPHGPVAQRLWDFLRAQAPLLRQADGRRRARAAKPQRPPARRAKASARGA